MSRRTVALLLAAAGVVASCTGKSDFTESTPPTPTTTSAPQPSQPADAELHIDPVTHTTSQLRSVADYERIAATGVGRQAVAKFSITEFSTDPEIVWLDSAFYSLHDEWYWFQLLNGRPVRGFDTPPVPDGTFEPSTGDRFGSIDEVYEWARSQADDLPLDLRFTSNERLYSNAFYEAVLDASEQRRLGVGALVRVPGDTASDGDRWLIELEFSDEVTVGQVDRYFEVVEASLPDALSDRLAWVPRSRAQELTAQALAESDSPNSGRVVRYDELAEPGDVEVYSPGISAGRILVVTDDGRWSLSDAGPDDIVVIDRAPDDLPPGNGLITGTPQTPLAHVNVLALNRGIPNAYLAGLATDPTIAQLGRVRSRVLVRTTLAGELDIVPLTEDEYEGWLATRGNSSISVAQPDPVGLSYSIDLAGLATEAATPDAVDALRPVIGGKAAGFIELAAPGTTTMPPDALAITVRPYVEHMAQFAPMIDAITEGSTITSSPRAQFLVLEGREAFDERFDSPDDVDFADDFEQRHPQGDDPLGDVLAAGGFVAMIRSSTVAPSTMAILTVQLREQFNGYSASQGLRFRSSSTVEDIEGFNGAGLYDSNTGYFDPTLLPDSDDHKRTVERALLRTWSSYWSAAAFAERQRESVDHRSGAMAVLVHARFDDPLEVSNGVATLTISPDLDTAYEMTVNAQAGAVSVTNPDDESGEQPEVFRVIEDRSGERRVERESGSTLIVASGEVLDNATANALFEQLRPVADSWLERANSQLPLAQRSSSLTLDFEFREMAAGWPARDIGPAEPRRMVVKQARTLDPGLRGIPTEVRALALPRDVLAYAATVVEIVCSHTSGDLIGHEVRTDPLAPVDFGFASSPLTIWASIAPDDRGACEERTLLSTSQQYLREVLATR
ncbi:MAG: hypothetical protein AB8G14_00365 [Ilumatobacter sp.]